MNDKSQHSVASDDTSHPLLPQAVALHREGQFDAAANIYRTILSELPHDFDATHLLGVIALQQGRFGDAQRLIHVALGISPHDTAAMANLGTSYMRVGQLESALQWFNLASRLEPDSPTANTNLGTVLHNMGRHRDAIVPLRQSYLRNSDSYAVCILLGASLAEIGDISDAIELFEAATRADPGNSEGWANLAMAQNTLGLHEEARVSAEKALALRPESPIALGALGKAQLNQGDVVEAIESYRRSVSTDPTADMLAAFGTALMSSGLTDEAIEQFERAVQLDKAQLKFRWTLTIARLKPIYGSESEVAAARQAFTKSLDEVQAWYEQTEKVTEPFAAVGVMQPFYLAYHSFNNRDLLGRYGNLCTTWMNTLPADIFVAKRFGHSGTEGAGKIRIGIVSAHIHQHSVWNAITRGWVYNLDRTQFELHLFKLDVMSDQETEKARLAADHFEDRPKTIAAWIQAIDGQKLDVIIYPEIGMHPLTLQLACLRLAPVQAASWGHPETTGLPTIDLYLSADALEPVNASKFYTEKLVRLPNLGVYVEPLGPAISSPGLKSLKLPGNESLLLCAGAPFKYSPRYDDVWVQIARQLRKKTFWRGRGGRLVFFRSRSVMMDRVLESRLRAAFEKADVDFAQHVSIVPLLDRSRFFGLMQQSALMLDTIGFSGFNTALQAIECALPVLAYEGEYMRGRLASSIMRRLDLPECVASTPEEYVHKTLQLATDAGYCKKIRAKIVERRHVLFHDHAPVRALQNCLADAVKEARSSLPAD